jgi:peptidoglycan/LPS O-acetylase OafA/YrhL
MRDSFHDTTRLVALDAIRGLAILLVVIFHYLHDRLLGGLANIVVGPFGLGGVTLFFMLSGLLIERHLARGANLPRYVSRRLFRILPAYFSCLAVIFTIDRFAPEAHHWSLRDITINVALLQDIFHAPLMLGVIWTLLIEIKFYAVAPLVKRAGPVALAATPFLAIAANIGILATRGEASTLLTYLTFCFVGMQFGPWSRGEMPAWRLVATVVAAAGMAFICADYYAVGLAVFVATDAAILALALQHPLSPPLLPFLGRISYSWYLYHAAIGYPIIAAVMDIGRSAPLAVALATVAGLSTAWLSFAVIEKPLIAFGRKFDKHLSAPAPNPKVGSKRRPV